MSTSCIEFKNKEFWENDFIVFIGLRLLLMSKQNKPKWLQKYFYSVVEYTLKIKPSGATVLHLDEYFLIYYKRKKIISYMSNVINEFELDQGGKFSYLEVDNMINSNLHDRYNEGYIEKKAIFEFYQNLMLILETKE